MASMWLVLQRRSGQHVYFSEFWLGCYSRILFVPAIWLNRFSIFTGAAVTMVAGESRGSAGSSADEDVCPIQAAWKDLPGLMERVSKKGRICFVGPGGVNRQCLIDNVDIIEPVLKAHGASIKLKQVHAMGMFHALFSLKIRHANT